jgi:hypothetical protein
MAEGSDLFLEPIVIVGAPRSGTSTLFATLYSHPALWSLHREARHILEGPFHPARRGWDSQRLTEADLNDALRREVHLAMFHEMGNVERLPLGRLVPLRGRGRPRVARALALLSRPLRRPPLRIVEKTVENCLRIPFLVRLFPDARFLHLTRHPRTNIAALYRAWHHPERFQDFPLPEGFIIRGHRGSHWSTILPPGWRACNGKTLTEVCAFQWRSAHEHCLLGSASLGPERYLQVRFEDLVGQPREVLRRISRWASLDPRPFDRFERRLPRINVLRGSLPDADVPQEDLERATDEVAGLAEQLGYR